MNSTQLAQSSEPQKIDLTTLDITSLVKDVVKQDLVLDASPCQINPTTYFYRFGSDFLHLYVSDDGRYRAVIEPRALSGRQVRLGMLHTHLSQLPPIRAPKLRAVKYALESYINAHNPDTSLHWISVIGEPSWEKACELYWLHDDHLIDVSVGDGSSEGSMIFVIARPHYNDIHWSIPLFQVKVLCGINAAHDEAKVIRKFFNSQELAALKAEHSQPQTA